MTLELGRNGTGDVNNIDGKPNIDKTEMKEKI